MCFRRNWVGGFEPEKSVPGRGSPSMVQNVKAQVWGSQIAAWSGFIFILFFFNLQVVTGADLKATTFPLLNAFPGLVLSISTLHNRLVRYYPQTDIRKRMKAHAKNGAQFSTGQDPGWRENPVGCLWWRVGMSGTIQAEIHTQCSSSTVAVTLTTALWFSACLKLAQLGRHFFVPQSVQFK